MEAEVDERASGDPVGLEEELIPDHARAKGERDLFDHGDYVDRLIQVIDHVDVSRTSANVALYGSWGSGKSGIGNVLEDRLADRKNVEYATFEAFKFGRDPLLRNFVARLSNQLLVEESGRVRAYRRRMYESTSRPFVDFDRMLESHPFWVFAITIVVGFLTAAALVLWVAPGSNYEQEAGNWFKFLALIVFGVLLSYFTLSRTRGPASGDEEFESIFAEMLERAGIGRDGRRLVVFVDELDRCAPSEVAATLESIRTFLGVPGCIFIVAADQQVLEHALTEQLRQSTPPDLANPYYSAGSAYLDKIFQYQLSFPPLRARRLSAFALELVDRRAGVWADPAVDNEDVVSILLPTHIHSPRRVKVLLNAFALTYGVASARAEPDREKLPDVTGRASELAKLVCIKLEFPLFARDLAMDDRLVPAVVIAAKALGGDGDSGEALERLPDELRMRALQYAKGELPVAQLLSDDKVVPWKRLEAAPDPEVDGEASGSDATEDGGPRDEVATKILRARHATQLVRYLEKTSRVEGPGADLIHLESAGARWGLDAQEAEILERDARDNRILAVIKRIADLDEEDRPKALLMLGQLSRELVGQEADSALDMMLAGAASAGVPLTSTIARRLVKDVEAYDERRGLKEHSLAGALAIGIAAGSEVLTESILEHDAIVLDEGLRFAVLENANALLPRHLDRMVEVLPATIRDDPERTHAALDVLEVGQIEDLLRLAARPMAHFGSVQSREADEQETAGNEEDAAKHKAAADVAIYGSLTLADRFLGKKPVLAELAVVPLFDIPYGATQVFGFLAKAGRLKTVDASRKVLEAIDGYGVEESVQLLKALDPEVIRGIDGAGEAMDRLAAHVWKERPAGATELPAGLKEEVDRLLAAGVESSGGVAAEAIRPSMDRTVTTDEEYAEFHADETFAHALADLELLSAPFVAECELQTVVRSITGIPPEPIPTHAIAGFRTSIRWASEDAPEQALEDALDLVQEETWLGDHRKFVVELVLRSALRPHRDVDVPTAAEVKALLVEERVDEQGVAAWIELFSPDPRDVYSVIEMSIRNPSALLLEVLEDYAKKRGPRDLAELNVPAISGAFARRPSARFFSAAELPRADEKLIGHAVTELVSRANNPKRRTLVFSVWRQMAPTDPEVREELIRKVFLRIAEDGASSHELARRHLELVADPPEGTKNELLERLVKSAPDAERRKKLKRRLEQVGLMKSSPSLFKQLFSRS